MAKRVDPDGPLDLLSAFGTSDAGMVQLLTQKLGGHSTAENFLPTESPWPELNEVAVEHRNARAAVVAGLEHVEAVGRKHRGEDERMSAAIEEAMRTGRPLPKDERTPPDARASERDVAEQSLRASIRILAEVADKAIALMREHLDEWLADLRGRHAGAEDEYRQAVAQADAKRREMHWVPLLGKWLQANAQDVGFGRQPVPSTENVPELHPSVVKEALQWPWYQEPSWLPRAGDVAARERGIKQRAAREAAEKAAGDVGELLALEDGEEAVIQPLDDHVRLGSAT